MSKNVKKVLSVIVTAIFCMLLSVGCSTKMTPKKLMLAVSENLAKAKSVTNTMPVSYTHLTLPTICSV